MERCMSEAASACNAFPASLVETSQACTTFPKREARVGSGTRGHTAKDPLQLRVDRSKRLFVYGLKNGDTSEQDSQRFLLRLHFSTELDSVEVLPVHPIKG